MPSNQLRSGSQFSAKPCRVTLARSSRTPIAHTLSSPLHAGLDVLPTVERDAEIPRRADHGVLDPPEVRGRVRRGAQVEDR